MSKTIISKPIPPTPDLKTEEDLKAFIEYMNRPATQSEKEQIIRAKKAFKEIEVD